MSKTKKKQKIAQHAAANFSLDQTQSWLFLSLLLLIPLLIQMKVSNFIVPNLTSGVSSGQKPEMLYYQSMLVLVIFTAMLVVFCIKLLAYRYEIKPSRLNVILLLLIGFILLSLLASDAKSIALTGNYSHREGGLQLLAYLGLFFIAANTKFSDRFIPRLNIVLAILVVINLGLSLLLMLGINLYDYSLVRSLVLPSSTGNTVGLNGVLKSTFTNPNYVSGLFAALSLYFLVFTLYSRNLKYRLIYLGITLAALLELVLAQSSSGFVALLLASPLLIILLIRRYPNKKVLLAGLLTMFLLGTGFLLVASSQERIWEAVTSPAEDFKAVPDYLRSIQQIDPAAEESLDLPEPGISPGNSRLYTWIKTVELIRERPLLGYGPDTFLYNFPQFDRQKRANFGKYDIGVDKTHNFYFYIAYGCGLPAALLFIGLVGAVLIKIIRMVFNQSELPVFPAAVMIFSLAYLIQWLFNDSIAASAVIYWSLSGMALSSQLNSRLAK